jgi:hypothetical protein
MIKDDERENGKKKGILSCGGSCVSELGNFRICENLRDFAEEERPYFRFLPPHGYWCSLANCPSTVRRSNERRTTGAGRNCLGRGAHESGPTGHPFIITFKDSRKFKLDVLQITSMLIDNNDDIDNTTTDVNMLQKTFKYHTMVIKNLDKWSKTIHKKLLDEMVAQYRTLPSNLPMDLKSYVVAFITPQEVFHYFRSSV